MGSSDSHSSEHDRRTQEFVRLLSVHDRALNGYILSLVPRLSDADEIAQETRLRLWQQFDQYDASKDFGAWARTIAFYLVRKHRTQSGRERLEFSDEFLTVVADEVAAKSDVLESRQRCLIACLQGLKADSQNLIRRYYSEKGSIPEVAKHFGRTIEGTKKALVRIRQSLRACVEKAMRREELP